MRKLLLLLGMISVSALAHAACTGVSSGATQAQIVSAISACSSAGGGTVNFAAGTYGPITSTVTIPCNVTLAGPTVLYSRTPNQTAIIQGTASSNFGWGFQTTAGCSAPQNFSYLEWNGKLPSNGGGGLRIVAGTTNFTFNNNYCHGVYAPGVDNGSQSNYASCVFLDGNSGGATTSNVNILWNIFGTSGDCANAIADTGNMENDNGGLCNGVGIHNNVANVTVNNNIFHNLEQGMKTFEAQGMCNPLTVNYNDFNNISRIMYETQCNIGSSSQPTLMYIDYNDWYGRTGGQQTYNISAANGCTSNYPNSAYCVTHTDNNVYLSYQSSGAADVGIEVWGSTGTTASGNLFEGNSNFAFGIDWSQTGNFVFNNNTFNMAGGAGKSTACAPTPSGGYWNYENYNNPPSTPTCTGNTFSSAGTGTYASATPAISPASTTFTGSQVVTLTNTGTGRDSNTSLWYTTDGTTPVPGSGTAQIYTAPFSVAATTAVNVVGMWGAANQPPTYATYHSGSGYVPSSVVSATYTLGGGPSTPQCGATLPGSPSQSTIQSALNACGAGNHVQLSAGTTSINTGSPLTIPCGVMLVGPTATPATAILNGGDGINFMATLNGACSSSANTGVSYVDFDHGGGLYVDGNSHTNVTLTHDQFTNIPDAATPCTAQCNNGSAGPRGNGTTTTTFAAKFATGTSNLINGFVFEYNSVSDANSCTNTITRTYIQDGSDGTGGPDGCGIEIFGQNSSPTIGFMQNAVIKYNNFYHVDEGIHFLPSMYNPGSPVNYANSFDIEYNWFHTVRRITIEWQAQTVSNPLIISNNAFTSPTYGNFNTFYLSDPCCQGGAIDGSSNGGANPGDIIQSNVGIAEGPANCNHTINCNAAVWWDEYWGNNAQNNYNLVQGAFNTGYEIGYQGFSPSSAQPYVQYNSLEGPYMGGQIGTGINIGGGTSGPGQYMVQEFGGNPGYTCCNTPNNLTTTVSTVTSVAPTVAPAGGAQAFPLTVTLTDPGYTAQSSYFPHGNTGIWYTTDNSTPVPGQGTAKRLDSGGTFVLPSAAIVKAVGMWGVPPQPTSYPSGFGFTPSAVVSASYTSGGATPTLTGVSIYLQDGTNTVQVGNSKQACASMTYSSGTSPQVVCGSGTDSNGTMPNAWASSDTTKATITSTGSVAGIAAGTANLTVHANTLTSAPLALTVTSAAPVFQSAALTCPSPVTVGQTQACSAQCTYSGSIVTNCTTTDSYGNVASAWTSSVPSVATVVATTGAITGAAAGQTTIGATVAGSAAQSATVTVTSNSPPAATLVSAAVSFSPPSIVVGGNAAALVTCTYSDGTTTNCTTVDGHGNDAGSFTSSATGVATINGTSGVATGVSAGSATIGSTVTGNATVTASTAVLTVTTPSSAQVLGNNFTNVVGGTSANYINAQYAVSPSGTTSTVSACTFYLPTGTTYAAGSKWDCGLVLAPSATTQATSWLCHATYTTAGDSSDVGWHNLPISGCGTLNSATAVWVSVDTNETSPGHPGEGFSNCSGSTCSGGVPTTNIGTYPCRYISAPYGTYTGMGTAMLTPCGNQTGGIQASQYVTLTTPTPTLTGGYLTAPGSLNALTVGASVQIFAAACYSDANCYLASPNADQYGDAVTSFTSSNPAVATVGAVGSMQPGLVIAIAPGTAVISSVLTGGKPTSSYGFTVSSTPQPLPPVSARVFSSR